MSRPKGTRGWVRFYPHIWRQETAGMRRFERDAYHDLCVEIWRNRRPVPAAMLAMIVRDLPMPDRLISRWERDGRIVLTGEGVTASAVTKMQAAPYLGRLPRDVWREIKRKIFRRDNYTCRYCGARGGRLECDHVHPIALGGSNEENNLVTACNPCNRKKAARTLEQLGWTL